MANRCQLFFLAVVLFGNTTAGYAQRPFPPPGQSELAVPSAELVRPGVFATFHGALAHPAQQDTIAFEVDVSRFTLAESGAISLGFLVSAARNSSLDPGAVSIVADPGEMVSAADVTRPHASGDRSSLTLASLQPGTYRLLVSARQQTTGAYKLEVFLAGDANGDLKVDSQDLSLIGDLRAVKLGESRYFPAADVDLNGVVDGGDLDRAKANFGASAQRNSAINPLDVPLPAGALSLVGASPESFNSRVEPLRFSLAGSEFEQDINEVTLTINGVRAENHRLSVAPNRITATSVLVDGRNQISLKAYDKVGRPLYLNTTLWAGAARLKVDLVNKDGTPLRAPARVVAALTDDQSVYAQAITSTGTLEFQNVPERAILVTAKTDTNLTGSIGVIGSRGYARITMLGIDSPSNINKFALPPDGARHRRGK